MFAVLRRTFALCGFAAGALAAADWPEFRGPTGQGISAATGLPAEWSPTKNVAWKIAVPGAGWSSPIVSRGRVFLTAAVAGEHESSYRLLCCDAASGRLEWSTELYTAGGPPPPPGHDRGLPASATPIADGDRLYVYFGHHGAACLDRAGKILWRNARLRFDPAPPGGGSPILAGEALVYVAECATAPFVTALDKHTGQTLWKVRRPLAAKMKFSFGAPLFITAAGRPQLIVSGPGAIAALDPATGRELWRVRCNQRDAVAPRPVFAHGLLFVSAGYLRTELLAIRPDGTGDVTDTHVAWRLAKGAPTTPALVALGDELYAVNDAGVATCWEARTGKVHWQERLDGNYAAAPVAADGRLYFQNDTGTGTVLRGAPAFEKLAVNPLDEPTRASPAISGGALFVRTAGHLYRFQLPP
jgi:outer membrane protein assembly factor BamB